ncbi:MAG: 2-C-methyl-D-erythritol 4-phosphate cytidylyltransferase [Christensenellaceae bacterium]|nr:2-C-methyl-D-erythritol 4-phosphate cytidylyltransferase [Christensenellaceae bacterium]
MTDHADNIGGASKRTYGSVCAILLAAGSSTRMGRNKMLMRLCGRTPIEWCIEAFAGIASEAVIAVSDETEKDARAAAKKAPFPVKIVRGGSRRQDSVYNAVAAASADIVSIHDCARCLVDKDTIARSILSAMEFGCGIASIPVIDTIRNAKSGEVVDRSTLLAAQTPQSFRRMEILAAYESAKGEYTDDAALFQAAGNRLFYSEGSLSNSKLTTPEDIPYFEFLLKRRSGK